MESQDGTAHITKKKITHAVVSPGVFNFSHLNWPHPNVEMKLVDLTGKGVLIDTTCQVNKQSLMSLSLSVCLCTQLNCIPRKNALIFKDHVDSFVSLWQN